MTVRFSTGTRNALSNSLGFNGAFNNGSIRVYSGAQPATADSAIAGTLLGTVTVSSGALTQETRAVGSVSLDTGAAGSVNTVTVGTFNIIPGGAVPFNATLAQTASDLCDAINRDGIFTATVVSALVTIRPRPGAGTTFNAATVTATLTTIGASYVSMSGGVAAVNSLKFTAPVVGVISKLASQIWSFAGVAVGTAGWFRLVGSDADAGGVSTTLCRVDGSIAVSGADLNLSNLAVAVGAPSTIDSFSLTIPAQ